MKEVRIAKVSETEIDPKFFNVVSQIAHFFTTYAIVLTVGLFCGWRGVATASVLCVLYAAGHEFWYDPTYENPLTRGSDIEDFCFLVAGVVAAVLISLIR